MSPPKLFAFAITTLIATLRAAEIPKPVADILSSQCGDCHSEKTKTSGFSVATAASVKQGGNKHGQAIVAGHPELSPLLKMIKGEVAPKMPMGRELAKADIASIEAWIAAMPAESAAKKTEWRWPFEKPARTPPPAVKNVAWLQNPIDAFVMQKLEQEGIEPSPATNKRTLARRVYLDLIGLPPTPEDLNAILADNSKDSYEKLVDRLLSDKRYGERWGRHWLDLARYGETSGLEGDGAIGNAWRFRDWVIDAFNKNMPFDTFVIKQIGGGDEHSQTRNNYQPDPQGFVPTGFLRMAPWDRSNLVAADVRQNYLSEVTTATSSIFLGLTMGCARCHDHKYDPIPQKDYYRLQAFFQATAAGSGIDVPFKDPEFAAKAKTKISDYQSKLKDGPQKQELDTFEKELLAKLIAVRKERSAGKDPTKADLRMEMKLSTGRIFSEAERQLYTDTLEDANRTQDQAEQQKLDSLETTLFEKMKQAYASAGFDAAKRFETLIVEDVRTEATAKYSGKSIFTKEEKARHGELAAKLDVYRLRLGRWNTNVLGVQVAPGPPNGPDIAPTRVLVRGDYRQPGDAVEPGFPSAVTGHQKPAEIITDRYRQFPTRGLRLTLARWIAGKDNPLTARVWVNRMWQYHFGQGIVRTTSDFGKNGDKPSHPELLDYLANRFMDEGWDVKAMHKLMVMSATYRQAADHPVLKEYTKDPGNRLLWKYNRRRLEAEALRDSILQVSGRLNLEMGGPSVFPPLPADLADFARYGRSGGLMWEPNEKEEDARRRSVYIFQRRSLPLPMMANFDAIVFSESCDRRSTTTTPLQALAMMNGYLSNEESAELAKRIVKETGGNEQSQIRRAFELTLNREPNEAEMLRLQQFKGGLEAVCRVLMNSNEFLYLE